MNIIIFFNIYIINIFILFKNIKTFKINIYIATEENLKDLRECNTDSEKCYEDMVDMEILNEPVIHY